MLLRVSILETSPKTDQNTAMSSAKEIENPSFVSAGFPNPAKDATDTPLNLNEYLIEHPASTYFMRITGDDLQSQGLKSGDIVVVDKSRSAAPNDLVIVAMEGELSVKQFVKSGSRNYLVTDENKSVSVDSQLDFEIWGVVVSVIRKLH